MDKCQKLWIKRVLYSEKTVFYPKTPSEKYICPLLARLQGLFKKTVDKLKNFYLKKAKKGFFAYFFSLILVWNFFLSTKTLIFTFPGTAPEMGLNCPAAASQLTYGGLMRRESGT